MKRVQAAPSGSTIAGGGGIAGEMNRYPGGKNGAGTWQWILSHVPPHAVYVEPFVGSGAILRRKAPAMCSVAIDREESVVRYWRRSKLPGLVAVHACGIQWLGEHADELCPDTLVYCDPPYPLSTRTKKRLYAHELTEAQHLVLLGCLLSLRCQVMVSSYWSPEYSTALRAWHCSQRDVITRGGTLRTEHLWCNFTPPQPGSIDAGGDGARAGNNFRERERIKRKVQRWRRMFAEMPPHERAAVLAALVAEGQRLEHRQG